MLHQLGEIKRRRKLLGLTQMQLSKLSGVSQSLIAKIESGTVDPSYSKTKSVFDALESVGREQSNKASDLMNKKVLKLSPKDSPFKAIKLMQQYSISQLPVFEGGANVGSISEKTLLERISGGVDISTRTIQEVMDDPFPVVPEASPLDLLVMLLQYNPAVLVDKSGKITGIVTKADLLKVYR